MEEYSYISTHPLGHTGPVTESLYLYLFINLPYVESVLNKFFTDIKQNGNKNSDR